MAQFDVYTNPSRTTKSAYPYIVDIQHDLLSEISTRMVIPLGKLVHFKNNKIQGLTLVVIYEGEQLLLLTPQIASVPSTFLKDPIGSLAQLRDEIISSIDLAITGI